MWADERTNLRQDWGARFLLGMIINNWGQDNHFWGAGFLLGVIIDNWGQDNHFGGEGFVCGGDYQHLGARLFTPYLEQLWRDVEALKVQPACSGAEPDRHVKHLAAGQQHAWLP